MDEESLQASFDLFGLSTEASLGEVERAFLELRNLYSEESLATYSLLDDTERQEKLEALHKAYERILQSHSHPAKAVAGLEQEDAFPSEPSRDSVDADAQRDPGLFLQQSRQMLGLSLQDMATRIKVRASLLQSIEEQRFDSLPAPVYLRGFLRQFARIVQVPNATALVDAFMSLYEDHGKS